MKSNALPNHSHTQKKSSLDSRNENKLPWARRHFLLLFFIFNLIVSSYYLDVWVNANTTSRALPIISFFENGSFRIDKYEQLTCDKAHVNKHFYTDKAPLPTYAVLPFFGLLKSTGLIRANDKGDLYGQHIYLLGGFLVGSLPFSLLILILFKAIRKNKGNISAVLMSMFPYYFSFLFVFAGSYFGHLFAGLLLLLAYLQLKKAHYFLAGLLSGLVFLSEYNLDVLIFMWGIVILIREKKLMPFVRFSLGILPSLIFIAFYNAYFTGSPFQFLYMYHNFGELSHNYGFILPGYESIIGLSFGWYRGLLIYAPFIALSLGLIIWHIVKGEKHSSLRHYLFLPSIVYYVFIASYFAWWGGWCYGPRLLSGMIILLLYEGSVFLSKQQVNKALFILVSIVGLILIFGAKITIAYSAPTGVYNPFASLVWPQIISGQLNPNNMLSLFLNISPSLSAVIFILFFALGTFYFNYLNGRWRST